MKENEESDTTNDTEYMTEEKNESMEWEVDDDKDLELYESEENSMLEHIY